MLNKKLLCLLVASTLTFSFGCSSNKDLYAPVEVPEIENVFEPIEVWSTSTQGNGNFYSQLIPSVRGTNVYIAGRKGEVYALDIQTGDTVWETDLSDEEENDNKRSTRLAGGMATSDKYTAVGSENGYIYVLNNKDGSIYFKEYVGAEVVTPPSFSRSGDKLFVLDSQGHLKAYDLASKKQLWSSGDESAQLHLRTQAKPVVVGDELVILGLSTGRVMMISQESGFVINQVTVGQNSGSTDLDRVTDVASTPLLLGNYMYTTAYNSGFIKYNLGTGAVESRLPYHSSKDIAYDDNYFVISGDDGHIFCVRRSDNVQQWENAMLSYRNITAPTIYGNFAVVGDLEGYVYFINLNNGQMYAKVEVSSSPIYVAPVVVGNCVLVYTADGELQVLCFDPGELVVAKKRFTDLEAATGQAATLIASQAMTQSAIGTSGITQEQLDERRAQARKIVAQIEAQERQMQERYREYQRQKAEYERRVAEYEKKRREQMSGYGLAPDVGVKSDETEEYVEDSE